MKLFDLINKGRIASPPEIHGKVPAISRADTFSVDAQNIWEAMKDAVMLAAGKTVQFDAHSLPCVTPPHEKLWFEWVDDTGSRGCLIHRRPSRENGFTLSGSLWNGNPTVGAFPFLLFECELTSEGRLVADVRISVDYFLGGRAPNQGERDGRIILFYVVFDSICKMHCRNVRLKPIAEAKAPRSRWNKVAPATIWHRIEISDEPIERSTGRAIFRDEAQCREYTVMGHYADYRNGTGLFGRYKVMIWIRDHKRGNPALGQVIPEYVIA